MITRGSILNIARIPLSDLRIFEYQRRYPDRLAHYLRLLEQNARDDLGVIHVKPRDYGFEVLDGHHRYTALVMSGRVDALCLIIEEPEYVSDTGTEDQADLEELRAKLSAPPRTDA